MIRMGAVWYILRKTKNSFERKLNNSLFLKFKVEKKKICNCCKTSIFSITITSASGLPPEMVLDPLALVSEFAPPTYLFQTMGDKLILPIETVEYI